MKEFNFKINGNDYNVVVKDLEDHVAKLTVNGTEYDVELGSPKAPMQVTKPTPISSVVAATTAAPAAAPVAKAAPAASGAGAVKSPLPGVIMSVDVKEGDSIRVGQRLVVLEAMKMENNIDSDKEGIVQAVKVSRGDSVLEGDVLVIIG